ncbi:MAG TPA: ABC transporter permease, partial [Blastocatellia bacterium]|nr:ABC transporter permease [Blastocatellia bacterium]
MGKLLQDLRYGLRILAGKPGFSAVAISTLALGIGANTAIFSVVYGVIIKALPYRDPGQLVRLYSEFPTFPGGGLRRFQVSGPEFLELRRDAHSWQALDIWTDGGVNLTGAVQPIRVQASFVSGTLLQSLAVAPIKGRLISPEDDLPGATKVAVISESLWQRTFGGDPNVIGRNTLLDGSERTIVGVMPASFDFPPGEINPPEMWVPVQLDPANPGSRSSHNFFMLGRMKPGITISRARGEMSQLLEHYRETAPAMTHSFSPDRHPVVMYPLKDEVTSNIRPALLMLLGAVFFVLLIACVNVANLLLARAEARQREIALRTALGAGRGRLARQFVTEGALLALAGGAAGSLLAYGGLRLLVATNAGLVPRVGEVSLNAKAMLVTLAVCLVTGVFFGLAPLAHVGAASLNDSLKSSVGRSTASAAAKMFRRILVTGEIALALVLL